MSLLERGVGHPKRAERAVPILTWLTPVGAVVSVINIALSMCTGEWLKSEERIPVPPPNGTTHKEDSFQIKRTVSGLWTLCSTNTTLELDWHCVGIAYFDKDRYTPDPNDSTSAIPYAVTKAGPLFILAGILLLGAIFSATLGHAVRTRRVAMFVGGIIFIIAGLIMLIGLVVYLSVLQSEIGSKLRPRNSLETPQFSYSYGMGFILTVIGFMSTELSGISAIFWYMYWHQLDWASKAIRSDSFGVGSCNNLNHVGECGTSTFDPSRHSHHQGRSQGESESLREDYNNGGKNGNGGVYGWRCDLHFPTSESKYQNSCGRSRKKGRALGFYFNEDYDLDVPLPPPPPFPRDLTSTTNISGEGIQEGGGTLGRGRKTTPV